MSPTENTTHVDEPQAEPPHKPSAGPAPAPAPTSAPAPTPTPESPPLTLPPHPKYGYTSARLDYLCLFHPPLNQREGSEEAQILHFYPAETTVDVQLRHVGLAQALSNFSGAFTGDALGGFDVVKSQRHRLFQYSPEPNFFLLARVALGYTTRIPRGEHSHPSLEYSDASVDDMCILASLRTIYRDSCFLHGPWTDMLRTMGPEGLSGLLGPFLDQARASRLTLLDPDIHVAINGIRAIDLTRTSLLLARHLAEEIASLGAAILITHRGLLLHSSLAPGDRTGDAWRWAATQWESTLRAEGARAREEKARRASTSAKGEEGEGGWWKGFVGTVSKVHPGTLGRAILDIGTSISAGKPPEEVGGEAEANPEPLISAPTAPQPTRVSQLETSQESLQSLGEEGEAPAGVWITTPLTSPEDRAPLTLLSGDVYVEGPRTPRRTSGSTTPNGNPIPSPPHAPLSPSPWPEGVEGKEGGLRRMLLFQGLQGIHVQVFLEDGTDTEEMYGRLYAILGEGVSELEDQVRRDRADLRRMSGEVYGPYRFVCLDERTGIVRSTLRRKRMRGELHRTLLRLRQEMITDPQTKERSGKCSESGFWVLGRREAGRELWVLVERADASLVVAGDEYWRCAALELGQIVPERLPQRRP